MSFPYGSSEVIPAANTNVDIILEATGLRCKTKTCPVTKKKSKGR